MLYVHACIYIWCIFRCIYSYLIKKLYVSIICFIHDTLTAFYKIISYDRQQSCFTYFLLFYLRWYLVFPRIAETGSRRETGYEYAMHTGRNLVPGQYTRVPIYKSLDYVTRKNINEIKIMGIATLRVCFKIIAIRKKMWNITKLKSISLKRLIKIFPY